MKVKGPATKDQFHQLLQLGAQPYLLVERTGNWWLRITREHILLCFRGEYDAETLSDMAGERTTVHSGGVGVELYSSCGGSVLAMETRKMRERVEEQRQKYQLWIDEFDKEALLNGDSSND